MQDEIRLLYCPVLYHCNLLGTWKAGTLQRTVLYSTEDDFMLASGDPLPEGGSRVIMVKPHTTYIQYSTVHSMSAPGSGWYSIYASDRTPVDIQSSTGYRNVILRPAIRPRALYSVLRRATEYSISLRGLPLPVLAADPRR
jgi:hypothetical protein